MQRLYCNGKKDFCDNPQCCNESCEFYDGSGSEYIKQEPAPAKVQTNADAIRAMSDEELAEHMADWQEWGGGLSTEMWLEWLRQPVDQKSSANIYGVDGDYSGLLDE